MESCRRIRLGLVELPMELVVEILKRVPAKSICHIRCVCKMLLSIVDSPSFVSLHSRLLLDPDSHLPPAPPQFLLHYYLSTYRDWHHYNHENLTTFHSLHYDPSNTQGSQLNPRLLLQLSNPTIYSQDFVFNNLFCINCWDDDCHSFLINPLRREILRLPPSHSIAQKVCGPNYKVKSYSAGMGFDSVTNTYKILRVTHIPIPNDSSVEICCVYQVLVLGTSEWRQVPTAPPSGALPQSYNNVCAYGNMHWLLSDHTREGIQGQVHILSFDFKKEEFFWIPNPYIFKGLSRHLHLINFRGSMAIVDTTSCTKIQIWMMKDCSKKQWMLDYSFNVHMLELDPQFEYQRVVCCEWEHGILFIERKENKILFLDLRGPVVTTNLLNYPIGGNVMDTWCRSLYVSLMSLKSYAN